MPCPADPTTRLNLSQEGIRLMRFSWKRWSLSPSDGSCSWLIRVQTPGASHRSEIMIQHQLTKNRLFHIPRSDAWAWTVALARQLNGNVHKPDPTPHKSPQDRTDMEENT